MRKSEDDLPRSGHLLLLASAAAIGGFLYWASEAEIDQITRAPGQVIASSRNQVIQELDGGIVTEILVKEGSLVKQGQPLVLFDRTKTETSYLESRAKAAALKAAQARLKAEVYGGQPKFPPELGEYPSIRANQEMLFKARQTALHEDIAAQRQTLGLIESELKMLLPLLEAGDVSKAEVLKLQRQVAEAQGAITNRRNKYRQESQTDLSKALEDLAGLAAAWPGPARKSCRSFPSTTTCSSRPR
jgi:adhesin transport system membrane fusion protein